MFGFISFIFESTEFSSNIFCVCDKNIDIISVSWVPLGIKYVSGYIKPSRLCMLSSCKKVNLSEKLALFSVNSMKNSLFTSPFSSSNSAICFMLYPSFIVTFSPIGLPPVLSDLSISSKL